MILVRARCLRELVNTVGAPLNSVFFCYENLRLTRQSRVRERPVRHDNQTRESDISNGGMFEIEFVTTPWNTIYVVWKTTTWALVYREAEYMYEAVLADGDISSCSTKEKVFTATKTVASISSHQFLFGSGGTRSCDERRSRQTKNHAATALSDYIS